MNDDPFEAGLIKLLKEEVEGDEKVVTPSWEKAWIIRESKLKLAIRNERGSAKPYNTSNIHFIAGLGLEEVFSKGMVYLARTKKASTANQNIRDLKSGFCAFLSTPLAGSKSSRKLWEAQQFTSADLSEFAKFLRMSNLSNSSRDGRVYAFKNIIIAYLAEADVSDPAFAAIDSLRKSTAFRDLAKAARSRTGDIKSDAEKAEKFLSPDMLLAINDAAEADVRKITLEWRNTQEMIERGQILLDDIGASSPNQMVKNLPLFLGWVAREFPATIPTKATLEESHKELYAVLEKSEDEGISIRGLRRSLHATSEEILPFFILLLIRTRFNVGTLNDIGWSDIADRGDVIVLAPYKSRAQKDQVRSEPAGDDKDPLSLRSIVSTLSSMTDRLRGIAHDPDKDKVFIMWSEKSGQVVRGLQNIFVNSTHGAFNAFIKKHRLDKFRPSNIRSTMLDAISNGIEGLEGSRREGNHSEAITTLQHYVSIRTAEGRRITLAETTHQTDRWSGTGGGIDPRYLPSNADLKSATPGFGCLNPFESPFPSDATGRLCRSEGHCARCENAFLRSDDPKLVAYVMAYAEAAANATHLPPGVFDELLEGYIRLLSEISREVLDQALQLPKPTVQIR